MGKIKTCTICGEDFEVFRRGNYQICPECKQKRIEAKRYKTCSICGETFKAKHGSQTICPECAEIVVRGRGRNIPDVYAPNYKVDNYEYHIRQAAIERAKHNDDIIGEGYAERQIQNTLSLVEPIKTEL